MMTAVERQRRQSRIQRAVARAWQQARAGVVPLLVERDDTIDGTQTYQTWIVPSRSGAAVYTVELLADAAGRCETQCDCPAGMTGQPCWHRAATRLAAFGRIASADATAPAVAEPELDDVAAFAAVA